MKLITFSIVMATAPMLHAQFVVTNPVSDILSQTLHLEDIAKQVEVIENQVEQINTLTRQLQQMQAYVKAFGDPSQLRNIVGADALVSSLRQSGIGQSLDTLQRTASGTNAMRYDANGLYRDIGTTFTTPNGAQLPCAEDIYKKFGAIQQSSLNLQTVTADVATRRKTLRKQIADTAKQLQSATTNAETQKLTGVLIGYNAELASVDREVEQAAAQLTAQDIENRADQARQTTARREERRAQIEEGFRRSSEAFRIDTSARQITHRASYALSRRMLPASLRIRAAVRSASGSSGEASRNADCQSSLTRRDAWGRVRWGRVLLCAEAVRDLRAPYGSMTMPYNAKPDVPRSSDSCPHRYRHPSAPDDWNTTRNPRQSCRTYGLSGVRVSSEKLSGFPMPHEPPRT